MDIFPNIQQVNIIAIFTLWVIERVFAQTPAKKTEQELQEEEELQLAIALSQSEEEEKAKQVGLGLRRRCNRDGGVLSSTIFIRFMMIDFLKQLTTNRSCVNCPSYRLCLTEEPGFQQIVSSNYFSISVCVVIFD